MAENDNSLHAMMEALHVAAAPVLKNAPSRLHQKMPLLQIAQTFQFPHCTSRLLNLQ
jgi:hypothetical protein